LTGLPSRYETATGNPRLNAVVIEADPETGKAVSIERISVSAQELDSLSPASASVAR
jgi:calcineurin-like phosphoesterase